MVQEKTKGSSIDELPTFFGPRQLAETMGISKDTAYRLVASQAFSCARIGRRIVIHKEGFLEWVMMNFSSK
ncbi:helix-turn-helix domain-containing protein [Anaerotruncus rubiinfantis]|uniref:helix-turn-helix domain-containing protein n=1 Tax=Anaerotruncus rubiinfantis TaxID=1720200 RepID=UPI0034A42015